MYLYPETQDEHAYVARQGPHDVFVFRGLLVKKCRRKGPAVKPGPAAAEGACGEGACGEGAFGEGPKTEITALLIVTPGWVQPHHKFVPPVGARGCPDIRQALKIMDRP
jgi:hypothetical protein